MADLFKNSLVYTMVMRNVDRVVEDRAGSVALLISAFMILSFIVHQAESACFRLYQDKQRDQRKAELTPQGGTQLVLAKSGLIIVLLELTIFMLELAANACVQFLSNLVARIASDSMVVEDAAWTIAATGMTALVSYIGITVAGHTLLQPDELREFEADRLITADAKRSD